MMNVSVIIPIGPGHEEIAKEAIASAEGQTVPVEVIAIHDRDRRGPAWVRNQGVKQSSGRYLVFLDADDLLMPTFVEETLRVIRGGQYVFTHWFEGSRVRKAEHRPLFFGPRDWHLVTTLLPKSSFNAVGGFDERLLGGEDTDLYLKLLSRKFCAIELPKPLVDYRNEGFRSKSFQRSEAYRKTLQLFSTRYGGRMGCCGEEGQRLIVGEKQEGDVLAYAMWGGERPMRGPATSRRYDGGNGGMMWTAPEDVNAAPQLWRQLTDDEVADLNKPPAEVTPEPSVAELQAQIATLTAQLEAARQPSVSTEDLTVRKGKVAKATE